MTIVYEARMSDSPYIESVTQGHTLCAGSTIRPAEVCWHMVLVRHLGGVQLLVVGPLAASGTAQWGSDAEMLWLKLKLGAFMPHLPTRCLLNAETPLPGAASQSFWLHGAAWQFPTYENVETFVARLARADVLVADPLVGQVLRGEPHDLSARTVRHRFLQATGLTQTQILQYQRAQHAAALLSTGTSILDTVDAAGYYDQPHLTRALRQWVGHTPAQIIRMSQPQCHTGQDESIAPAYDDLALTTG